ncbi:MAG: hypothetical protein ACOYNL_08220 [Rickettsiales bacterium]
MTSAGDVTACARRFVGMRFAHQGRTVAGLDCLGLVMLVVQELRLEFGGKGLHALDVPHYGARPDALLLKKKLDSH